jgi:hypothetical protein
MWISRLRALFQRKRLAEELDEELEFHLLMGQQWSEERGVEAVTARREARLRLRGVLYGVSRVDGVSFGGVSLFVVAIALLATYLPSRRAMRVQPMDALRAE